MKSNHRQDERSRMIAMALKMLAALFMTAGVAVPAQAQTPTLLHSFNDGTTDACAPRGNIVQGRDGNMYGGGAACGVGGGGGAIYKISPAGVESVFFNFPPQWTNCGGAGLTLGSDGNFYGACEGGNPATGMGSIFRLTPAGVFTDLHDFTGANGDSLPMYPPIQGVDGNFYGVSGNEVQVCGNVYKLTPAGVYTNLHTFVFGNECHSSNLVQASDGNLYGTLADCAVVQGAGCVYKISPAGVFKEIHDFAFTTGQVPCTGLIQGKDGKLYGATQQGAANGSGNIYKLTTAGIATDFHDFTNATDASCVNNVGPPVNLLQVADGSFYGVNPAYGPNGTGSIYKLTSAGVFTAFLFPNPPVDGDLPSSTLIQHTNGLVYGTTPSGGNPASCAFVCQGTFFGVATGDLPFVSLEPTQKTGNVGAKVGVFGQGFTSASVVKFGGVAAKSVTLSGTTYLTAVVPTGAHTGAVTVTTGTTTRTSPQTYRVKPKITNFTPSSGPAGTLVTINGTGLIQTSVVNFGTVKATTFTVKSDSQVTANVPAGLPASAVTISITTPGGTAISPTKFTVN
jgi:uncharacterized repeat protein (TIGR03803 family)